MKKGRYFLLLIGILSSCSSLQNPSNSNSTQVSISETIINNEVETWTILENSIYETRKILGV